MNLVRHKSVALAATALAVVMSTSAFAQDGGSQPPTQVAAEEANNSTASNPGDIIVTAQRVEQRLQDVPIAITVFNQAQLTQRNIAVAADLATYTPSLQVNQRYGPEKSNFSLRGFNQDQGTAPTVGVYFAEVVGVRAQGGTTSGNTVGAGAFSDLANVQVLKGPQGTLFGRNTTGGAILLTPQKPTDLLEGYVEGTYGNYDQKKVTAVANIPLADTFKVRMVFERNKRDGYMINRSGAGASDYNDVNYTYGRLSIVADLTPDLENYTVFHMSQSDTRGYASRIIGCASPTSPINPLNVNVGTPGYSGTRHLQAASCAIQLARQTARGDSLYDVEVRNPNPDLSIQQWQVINTTTWHTSDAITIKNIMSYGEFRERANFDLGSSNFVVPGVDPLPGGGTGFNLGRISPQLGSFNAVAGTPYSRIVLDVAGPNDYNSKQSTFTEELQIQGHSENLDYLVGGYLEFSRPLGFSSGRTGIFLDCTQPSTLACTNPLFFGSISESSTKLSFNNHGVFAQATYKFSDALSLTAGGRYTFDKIVGFTNGTRAGFSANAGTGPLFVDPVSGKNIARACTDSFRHGPGALAAAGLAGPGLDRSVCDTTLTNKSTAPTWHISLDYKLSSDALLYAKYDRGYRQGGLNFTNPGVESWAPERLDAFEAGAKVTFRGAVSGYFNIAAFYDKLANQQVFAQLTATPAAAATGVAGGNAIVNAGKSRIYGLDVDASLLFFDSFRLSAGYAYVNTRVSQVAPAAIQGDGSALGQLLVGTPFGTIIPTVQAGSVFTNAPKHKLTVNGTYTLPIDKSLGDLSLGVTWVYQSSYINDGAVPAFVNGTPLGFTPATNLVNLNLDWRRVAGSPVDLSLFVTNLTKETYNVANTGAWGSAGVAEILLNQPRFYGARVRFTFGS
ncbi:MAG: TonB-dependent receptor [Novosphingobium sp.]|nr:TonB-dependent receptor [Novosphingobium sp.]